MSATEELRRLLDERGADWHIEFDGATEWESAAGDYSSAVDVGDGKLIFTGCLTPEQAIAATLGQAERTCKLDYERHCSNCGVYVHESAVLVRKDLDDGAWTVVSKPANYCPNCGARIEVSDE